MERAWKVTNVFVLGLVLIGLCSGFPIGLENSAADYHTQFLTGLVGVLLTVCGVVFLAGCLCCQRKNGFKEFHNNPVVASSTSSLDHGHINPIANGEFTIFTPLSPPVHNNNVFLANEQIVGQTEIDYNHAEFDVRSWFDGTETDFPRTRLKYIKEIGKGWFGRVVEGTAQILNDGDEKQNWTPVAVRILEASATSSERAVFLQDAIIYRCGKHPHILQLLGRSLESVPLLLLQELCPRGDLKKYLRDNRTTAETLLSSDLPLLWCCQLSSALKHLHDHRLTHPDLAARNCQVVSDLSIKLGDYGLAASLYPEDYYEGAPAVPVRWCSPESLTYTSTTIQPKQITFESNVWSLGVTMWEIYECGAQPYMNLTDDDVLSQVLGSTNMRLSKPEFSILYTDYIFRLMQLCWSTSESRPSVSQVHLMLTDLMQVYQNTKHITHTEPQISIQDFDKRWDTFKPNNVAKTDNHEFTQESVSMADVDLSDITILNLNLGKDEELLNTKPMSPSLNNLHGSLDNLASGEMDSWLQKVATKTGDMNYVRGLSEAIKDLDNALALENFSSSDSSHQPSPAPENVPNPKNKLEFKLGPTYNNSDDLNKTQNSSLTESMQRTSSESETEDENWRRKIEQGAYSEKVHQKSKSVTDLMVLTHIDCSESDSETPLPSLDYRVNYKNVRYAPKQNLENVSLMFGSEGNLLSVHDKFQEELRRLQEERKDSLLFVPESISHNDEKPNKQSRISESIRSTENSSSDEETWTVGKSEDATCTYVNRNPSTRDHRNPESLIEELSSPSDIQPGNQVYNIFNVTVDAKFSPMHLKSNLKEIICFKESESENGDFETVNKNSINDESTIRSFQVPKLTELIQNNDDLMNYIITRYESQEDVNINPDVNINISETKDLGKELNNNIQSSLDLPSSSKPTENVQTITQHFLQNEQQNYEVPKVHFDISQTQKELSASSMTHSSVCTSTPFAKRTKKLDASEEKESETLQFSSNFSDLHEEEDKSELKYSLETWDNFLGTALDGSRECSGFENYSSEPQSLLFVDENRVLNAECKNEALIESFNLKNDLGLQADVNIVDLETNVNKEDNKDTKMGIVEDLKEDCPKSCKINNENSTFVVEQDINQTFVCEGKNTEDNNVYSAPKEQQNTDETFVCGDKKIEDNEDFSSAPNKQQNVDKTFVCPLEHEQLGGNDDLINDGTVVLNDKDEQLDGTYTKEHEGESNWEPGEGWFLHPQTNSEVSGQMEVSQGSEESYVGFSMDDEIMAAIRNELLMKLPQAQGQSSEQVRDTDEWDTEGRSEVLIKYNVYTTPLSPIPEESYSENDSYHLIYNREDSSDSENEDWPEPYEEHNSGLPDTETQSMQNAESPIPEPQNRHTPSQDSCCSNDTLFNLEELTFVVNENENSKLHLDLEERKGCDIFEINKKDKKLEEPTLKIGEQGKKDTENCIKEVNKFFLETEIKKIKEGMETVSGTGEGKLTNDAIVHKNTSNFKTEIFTCNIEPTQIETLPKMEEHALESGIVSESNQEESSDQKTNNRILEEKEEFTENNQTFSEFVENMKEEQLNMTFKTDHETLFPDNNVSNFTNFKAENKSTESDEPNLKITEVSFNEINMRKSVDVDDQRDEVDVPEVDNIKKNDINLIECKNITNSEAFKEDTIINEVKSLKEDIYLDKNEALTETELIDACQTVSTLEKCKDFEECEAITIQNKVNACQSTNSVENYEQNEIEFQKDLIFPTKIEVDASYTNMDLIKVNDKNEENIKEGKVINGNEVNVNHSEVFTNHQNKNINEHQEIITSDPFNNMEKESNEVYQKIVSPEDGKNMEEDSNKVHEKIMSPQDGEHMEEESKEVHEKIMGPQVGENMEEESNEVHEKIMGPQVGENMEEGSNKVHEKIMSPQVGEHMEEESKEVHQEIMSAQVSENIEEESNEVCKKIMSPQIGEHMKKESKEVHEKIMSPQIGENMEEESQKVQEKVMTPQVGENDDKSNISVNEIENIVEADINKKEGSISLDEVSNNVNVNGKPTERCEIDPSLSDLHFSDEEAKQNEDFNVYQVNTKQSKSNIKENKVGEKSIENKTNKVEEEKDKVENEKDELKVANSKSSETNAEENLIQIFEKTNDIGTDVDKTININVDQNLGIKKVDNEVLVSQNEVRVNESKEISEIPHNNVSMLQNGFLSNSIEADLENINVSFIGKEADFVKTDDTIIEDLESGTIVNKINNNQEDKLNKKNIQNGITPENSLTWINENHPDLLNVFENLNEVSNTKNETTPSQIKEPSQTVGKPCDFMDISLIVENNPNYITEFLNHERQSSVVSSRNDDPDPSLQNFNSKPTEEHDYVNIDDICIKNVEDSEPGTDSASYVNTNELTASTSDFNLQPEYVNTTQEPDLNSPPEYVNIAQQTDLNLQPEYVNTVQNEDTDEHLYDPVANEGGDGDIYDALSDIRFTGPSDVQLMSTSFSESADIDEQDWDSGSDTRSSSSGEFIWKEGEHEESVKALRAAPQDVIATDKLTPMEDIEEVSTESSEDEDGDSPEFVPSAWDKYATPTKSALRSPEKTLEKTEVKHKKPKGVWFKKQKYHCVYEYPREPESPSVNNFDLWQPSASLMDWEVDTSPYVPIFDGAHPHPECYQQLDSHTKNLYQLPDFSSGMTALDDEFYISSTARPFESFGGLSSQFFPGQTTSDQWMDLSKQPIENITPDSGVEDITPSNIDGNEFLQAPPKHQVQPLKILATVVLKNNQISELKNNNKDALGGLRHARNKLKLDLPPSPSAFTSTKVFTIEPPEEEPITKREVPTFTTFGKSRFLVQHVDTPTCDEENESKNVSFEALPYKPAQVNNKEDKTKIEVVRGEASLLDSADEDSGIESSTLERKKITNLAD